MFRSVAQNVGRTRSAYCSRAWATTARAASRKCASGAPARSRRTRPAVVWGMPGTAVRLGAAMHVLPIQHIAVQVLNLAAAAAAA